MGTSVVWRSEIGAADGAAQPAGGTCGKCLRASESDHSLAAFFLVAEPQRRVAETKSKLLRVRKPQAWSQSSQDRRHAPDAQLQRDANQSDWNGDETDQNEQSQRQGCFEVAKTAQGRKVDRMRPVWAPGKRLGKSRLIDRHYITTAPYLTTSTMAL
jgi:hypothetical protein